MHKNFVGGFHGSVCLPL